MKTPTSPARIARRRTTTADGTSKKGLSRICGAAMLGTWRNRA